MSVVRGREQVLTPSCPDKLGIVHVSSSFLVAVRDGAQVLVIPPRQCRRPGFPADGSPARAGGNHPPARLAAGVLGGLVNRVGTGARWSSGRVPRGGSPRPGGRRAPLSTEQLVDLDLDLAEIARYHREIPLLENPGLYLLRQERGRLMTNRQEVGVHSGEGLFAA